MFSFFLYKKELIEYAVEYNNIEAVILLLSYNCDPNTKSTTGIPLMFIAASKGYYDIVIAFVTRGADLYIVDNENCNILSVIIKGLNKYNNPKTLEYISFLIFKCGCIIQREILPKDICNYVLLLSKFYNNMDDKDNKHSLLSSEFIGYGPILTNIKVDDIIPFLPYSVDYNKQEIKDIITEKINTYGTEELRNKLQKVYIFIFRLLMIENMKVFIIIIH